MQKSNFKTTFSNEIVTAQMERKHFSTLIQSNRKTTIPILNNLINFLDLNMPVMGVGNF
jgi:hypothetical protein